MRNTTRMPTARTTLCAVLSLASLGAPHPDLGVDALPIGPAQSHVAYFPKTLRAELDEALELPAAEARALLASDDPRDRGIGIFVASFNGDLDTLLAATALLDDDRQTIPVGLPHPGAIWWIDGTISLMHEPRTVGGYLRTQYAAWLGLPPDTPVDRVQETVRRVAQDGAAPTHAHYWATRYGLARDAQAQEAVLQEIMRLPESLRWAVASELAFATNAQEDARRVARTIRATTANLIRDRTIELPPDLTYQQEAHREGLFRRFDHLRRSGEPQQEG